MLRRPRQIQVPAVGDAARVIVVSRIVYCFYNEPTLSGSQAPGATTSGRPLLALHRPLLTWAPLREQFRDFIVP